MELHVPDGDMNVGSLHWDDGDVNEGDDEAWRTCHFGKHAL